MLSDYASDMDNCVDLYHIGRGRFIVVLKENTDQTVDDVLKNLLKTVENPDRYSRRMLKK